MFSLEFKKLFSMTNIKNSLRETKSDSWMEASLHTLAGKEE